MANELGLWSKKKNEDGIIPFDESQSPREYSHERRNIFKTI